MTDEVKQNTSDFLTGMREQIAARKAELQPAYEEYVKLQQAETTLGNVIGANVPAPPAPKNRPGRPKKAAQQ